MGPDGVWPEFSYIRSSRVEMLPELSYLRANIRLIGGDWNLCFYITVDNELYYVNYTSRYQLELIFVAKNVKHASICFINTDEDETSIYYLHFQTLDSIKWVYTSDREIRELGVDDFHSNVPYACLDHENLVVDGTIIDTDIIGFLGHRALTYIKRA